MPSVPIVWGATEAEVAARYPCDELVPGAALSLWRAIGVRAPRAHVFRWLCQLKEAPYSYDLIDNRGRRSPRTLTPGADDLHVGDRIATIFTLEGFARDDHLTLRITDPVAVTLFGPAVLTYAVRGDTRIVAKLNCGARGDGPLQAARRSALAWGDLVMMRKQLRTFRELAEA